MTFFIARTVKVTRYKQNENQCGLDRVIRQSWILGKTCRESESETKGREKCTKTYIAQTFKTSWNSFCFQINGQEMFTYK